MSKNLYNILHSIQLHNHQQKVDNIPNSNIPHAKYQPPTIRINIIKSQSHNTLSDIPLNEIHNNDKKMTSQLEIPRSTDNEKNKIKKNNMFKITMMLKNSPSSGLIIHLSVNIT